MFIRSSRLLLPRSCGVYCGQAGTVITMAIPRQRKPHRKTPRISGVSIPLDRRTAPCINFILTLLLRHFARRFRGRRQAFCCEASSVCSPRIRVLEKRADRQKIMRPHPHEKIRFSVLGYAFVGRGLIRNGHCIGTSMPKPVNREGDYSYFGTNVNLNSPASR